MKKNYCNLTLSNSALLSAKHLSLVLALLFSFCTKGISQGCNGNYLHASGSKLLDANNNEVRLTGVNWFGFETANKAPHGLWSRDCKSMLLQIKDLGFNCVRIPWSNAILQPDATMSGISNAPVADPYTGISPLNAIEATYVSPIALLDKIVEYCQELNLKIILDNHSRNPDGYISEELWYTASVSHEKWVADWVFMAERYKGLDAVVAMDINNEPHGASRWGTGNPANDWRWAAEQCGNAILEVNPDVLIMVEGVENYANDTYWWGGNLQGVAQYPVQLTNPSKLVYSPHEYGPTVFAQPWFEDSAFPTNMPNIWEKQFNYIITNNIAPLFAGEFGIKQQGGKDEVWFDTYLQFMGEKGYSWTFWCWNPNSGDTGGILQDDWTSINQWKVNKLMPYLANEIPNGDVCNTEYYTITATANSGGSITPSGTVPVEANGSKTFNITPALGYAINNVVVNGVPQGPISTYTFTNINANATIEANFAPNDNNNHAPVAQISTEKTSGTAPLTVYFDGSMSTDTDGDDLNYLWFINQEPVATAPSFEHTFNNTGAFEISLQVSDDNESSTAAIVITVTNDDDECNINVPQTSPLNSIQHTYNHIFTSGTGAPDLSHVTEFIFNWDLANNGLHQMSIQTNNGAPNWWLDLKIHSTYSLNQGSPSLVIDGSGIIDGDYWVTTADNDLIFVRKDNSYSLYFSINNVPPTCFQTLRRGHTPPDGKRPTVNVYPNPFTNGITLDITNMECIEKLELITPFDEVLYTIEGEEITSKIELETSQLSPGILFVKVYTTEKIKYIKLLKTN